MQENFEFKGRPSAPIQTQITEATLRLVDETFLRVDELDLHNPFQDVPENKQLQAALLERNQPLRDLLTITITHPDILPHTRFTKTDEALLDSERYADEQTAEVLNALANGDIELPGDASDDVRNLQTLIQGRMTAHKAEVLRKITEDIYNYGQLPKDSIDHGDLFVLAELLHGITQGHEDIAAIVKNGPKLPKTASIHMFGTKVAIRGKDIRTFTVLCMALHETLTPAILTYRE